MRKLVFWSIVALAVSMPSSARVGAAEPKQDADYQDDPATVSPSDIEGLNNKITDLAKSARVGLLLQTQYTNSGFNAFQPKGFNSPVKVSTVGGGTYFDLLSVKRAEISVWGDLADKKISYKVQYDPAATTTAKAGVSSGEQLKDYWIQATSYIPYLDFKLGQFKYPQALEGRTASGELDFNNIALITTALEARRDQTFQVSGSKIPVGPVNLEYAAAVVQGAGQNTADNNENKDFAGRVGLTVPDLGIYLGASTYAGWEQTTTYGGDRSNIGFEGRVTQDGLKVQGEYVQGQLESGNNYDPWTGISAGTNKQSKPQGWYATISYRLDDLRLGIRGESFNADTTNGSKYNLNNDVATVGLDWFQGKDKFKLSLDFEEHYSQYEAVIVQAQVNI